MNNYHCTQPDFRDDFSRLIEMFSPAMNPQEESFLRSISANTYGRDFATIMGLLNGSIRFAYINGKTLENAADYYKQLNKSLLVFRNLTVPEKLRESKEIDAEADRLKDIWSKQLKQRGYL